jgi:hypothetical protein
MLAALESNGIKVFARRRYPPIQDWKPFGWYVSPFGGVGRAVNWTLSRPHVKLRRFLSLAVAIL